MEGKSSQPSETQEQALSRILAQLQSPEEGARLSALRELENLNYSSPAILHQLEKMAVSDSNDAARGKARGILVSPVHKYIQGRLITLPRNPRQLVLQEIEVWEKDGLIR